jgi:hypothetical protein
MGVYPDRNMDIQRTSDPWPFSLIIRRLNLRISKMMNRKEGFSGNFPMVVLGFPMVVLGFPIADSSPPKNAKAQKGISRKEGKAQRKMQLISRKNAKAQRKQVIVARRGMQKAKKVFLAKMVRR